MVGLKPTLAEPLGLVDVGSPMIDTDQLILNASDEYLETTPEPNSAASQLAPSLGLLVQWDAGGMSAIHGVPSGVQRAANESAGDALRPLVL